MGFYGERILPHLIRLAMRDARLAPYRERVASSAKGRTLEIGIGAGENLSRFGALVLGDEGFGEIEDCPAAHSGE